MRLNNLFESNHPKKLYESYRSFIKDNNNEQLLKETVENNMHSVMSNQYEQSSLAQILMDYHEDELYEFWKANGGQGLPKGLGTQQAFNQYKSWMKKALSLNESQQEKAIQNLYEGKQDFIKMFGVIDEVKELHNSLEKDSDEEISVEAKMTQGTKLFHDISNYNSTGEYFLEHLKQYFDNTRTNYIIFFLRMYKGVIIKGWMDNGLVSVIEEIDPQLAKRLYKQFSILKGQIDELNTNVTFSSIKNFIEKVQHFLSFDYQPIQQLNPLDYKSFAELGMALSRLEDEWREQIAEEKRYLELKENDEIIKDYGDYVWIKLDRSRCEEEADAMGHCGNAPAGDTDARILSFRELVKKGDKTLYKPHLTFILEENGYLGEMKGYANDKPSSKYHPYIIELLQMDFIKGIMGGGYDPQNNFDMSDLDEDTREQLVEEKPTLEPLKFYENSMKENGYVDNNEILDVVTEYLEEEYDIQVKPMYALGYVVINMDINDDTLRASDDTVNLIEILNGEDNQQRIDIEDDLSPNYDMNDFRKVMEIVQEDQPEQYDKIVSRVHNYLEKVNNAEPSLIDVYFDNYKAFYEEYDTSDLAEFLYDLDYGTIDGSNITNDIKDDDEFVLSEEQLDFIENELEVINDEVVLPITNIFPRIAFENSERISFNKLKKEIYDEIHFTTLTDDQELTQLTISLIDDGELYEVPIKSIEEIENEGMAVELDVSFTIEDMIDTRTIEDYRDVIDIDLPE